MPYRVRTESVSVVFLFFFEKTYLFNGFLSSALCLSGQKTQKKVIEKLAEAEKGATFAPALEAKFIGKY
jgi:hypothetical protein